MAWKTSKNSWSFYYTYIYIHVVFVSFFEKKINLPTILGVRVFVFFQETHCFQVDLKKYFSI